MTARDWKPGDLDVTAHDVLTVAVEQRTPEAAAAHMAKCVAHSVLVHGHTEEKAKEDFLHSLGYWTGYFGPEDAKRVRELYDTTHPVFGSAIEKPMPRASAILDPRAVLGPLGPAPTPVEAERIRITYQLDQLRSHMHALELSLKDSLQGIPPGPEAGQALTQAAGTISVSFGRLDAYMRAEAKK